MAREASGYTRRCRVGSSAKLAKLAKLAKEEA
jgi:hypothetical protein